MIRYLLIGLFIASPVMAQKEFVIKGTMHYTELEGGCWYLEAKKKKYELIGSPEQMSTVRVDGRPLTLLVKQAYNMQSICMIGPMLEIIEIYDTVAHPRTPPVEKLRVTGRIGVTEDSCWFVKTKAGIRYELLEPVPPRYKKIGARYNRISRVVPASEGDCDLNFAIIQVGIPILPTPKFTKERNYELKKDPR
jgi:hypothetical protein